MKKRAKIIVLIIVLVVILIILLAIYFLFLNKTTRDYFGFSSPDFSQTASMGDIVGQATDTNSFQDAKLNPFRNET